LDSPERHRSADYRRCWLRNSLALTSSLKFIRSVQIAVPGSSPPPSRRPLRDKRRSRVDRPSDLVNEIERMLRYAHPITDRSPIDLAVHAARGVSAAAGANSLRLALA